MNSLSFFLSRFCLFLALGAAGCVDLSGSRSNYQSLHALQEAAKKKPPRGQVHTMRGGLGIFSIGMNQLRDKVEAQYNIPAQSTMWYNAGDVSRFIIASYRQQAEPIILIGHSLGANEQIKVARNLNAAGVPVALLITVDAVSQTIIPPNVKEAFNVYKPGFVPMFSGLKLRAVNPHATQIENLNVNTLQAIRVNHFTIDKNKVLQALILDKVKKALVNGDRKET